MHGQRSSEVVNRSVLPLIEGPGKGRNMAKFTNVDEYIGNSEGWVREVLSHYRGVIRSAAPEAEEGIKWSQPVFSDHGPAVYLRAFKNHVNLGFWRGASLRDPEGLIVSGGDKMGHLRITQDRRPADGYVADLVRQAVALNRSQGDPTREQRSS